MYFLHNLFVLSMLCELKINYWKKLYIYITNIFVFLHAAFH